MSTNAPNPALPASAGRGFWQEAWRRFRRKKLGMAALAYVVALSLVALFSPLIVGAKPIVCRYQGSYYFPAMSYYYGRWENAIFFRDGFYQRYPVPLAEKDPESWAIWPLVFQDPDRPIEPDEWPGLPAGEPYETPNRDHWFGTNKEGVDIFAQMIHGTRVAVLVGFVSTGLAALIGITIGALAGYAGGWVDVALSRLIELVMCVPSLILILAMLAIVERPTIWHIMVVLGVTGWTSIARLTRAEFMKLKQMDYVVGARALGAGHARIMFVHLLRNGLAPALVPISFGVASAILTESGLSFLGFGPANTLSWGTLLSAGRSSLAMWWMTLFPGLAIFFIVLAYNLIGEGLQDAIDPRLREAGK